MGAWRSTGVRGGRGIGRGGVSGTRARRGGTERRGPALRHAARARPGRGRALEEGRGFRPRWSEGARGVMRSSGARGAPGFGRRDTGFHQRNGGRQPVGPTAAGGARPCSNGSSFSQSFRCRKDAVHDGGVGDRRHDLHFESQASTQRQVDIEDAPEQPRPASPRGLPRRQGGSGLGRWCRLAIPQALAARPPRVRLESQA